MPFGSYESVGRGFESLPSHQEKPVHIVCWFFFFVCAMEGARTGRRRIAPQAISPVGCCLARGFQRVGMSTVEAVNRKISWLFCFSGRECTVFARWVLSMSDDVGRCIALQSVPFFCFCALSGCGSGEQPCPLGFALPGCAPLHRCRKFSPVELPKIRPESST